MLAVLGLHIFGTVGINLCYHRLLNHCGVVCPKTVSAIVSQEVRKCGRAAAPRPNMWYKRLIPEFATYGTRKNNCYNFFGRGWTV
jgi:hypothetical protein